MVALIPLGRHGGLPVQEPEFLRGSGQALRRWLRMTRIHRARTIPNPHYSSIRGNRTSWRGVADRSYEESEGWYKFSLPDRPQRV